MLGSYEDKITYVRTDHQHDTLCYFVFFNEFVLTLVVIHNIIMKSKSNNIGLYISPFRRVYDKRDVQSSCGHSWSGKCSIRSRHFRQHKLSIHVKTLLCISCTSLSVGMCYFFSFSASLV